MILGAEAQIKKSRFPSRLQQMFQPAPNNCRLFYRHHRLSYNLLNHYHNHHQQLEIILITTSTESAPTIVTTSTESTPATSTIATSTQGLLSTFWQLGLLYYWFTSL